MGQVWRLIEQHQDSTPYGASVREIARGAGIKESTLPRWRDLKRMPEPDHLRALARQINVPYRVLLDAALADTGYLDARSEREDVGNDGRSAPNRQAGGSPAEDELAARRRDETPEADLQWASHPKKGRESEGRQLRRQLDEVGEENQDPGE